MAVVTATLEVTFDASGAAEAGRRGRVVAVVDVVDASTSAEAALEAGAAEVLGAAPAGLEYPVAVDPAAMARRAADAARRLRTRVVVVAEPRAGDDGDRAARASSVTAVLREAGVRHELVPNQGAELGSLAELSGSVVVIVSATGGAAFDAAIVAGAAAVCFATTARVRGKTGWQVAQVGALRAIGLARAHGTGITVVAASANSADDVLGAVEVARAALAEGFGRR